MGRELTIISSFILILIGGLFLNHGIGLLDKNDMNIKIQKHLSNLSGGQPSYAEHERVAKLLNEKRDTDRFFNDVERLSYGEYELLVRNANSEFLFICKNGVWKEYTARRLEKQLKDKKVMSLFNDRETVNNELGNCLVMKTSKQMEYTSNNREGLIRAFKMQYGDIFSILDEDSNKIESNRNSYDDENESSCIVMGLC